MDGDLIEYRDMLAAIEKRVLKQAYPRPMRARFHFALGCIGVVLVMPHSGSSTVWGWIANACGVEQQPLRVLSYASVFFMATFAVFVAVLARAAGRIGGMIVATCVCLLSIVFGVLAVWSLDSRDESALGDVASIGLLICTSTLSIMTVRWLYIAAKSLPCQDS
ncbi:Rv2732c family membrane protein [Rhodococcus erythropolis]|uniref:Rv2732c family membrane protein n=1 Tax=Rhodococcus erythropolis TaxID=1833 RepID=UPI000878A609|nr:hypothetical protein [Rhodococcus erythropolis]OFV73519.1 hypothetical protein RERY_58450 [Rhodococcus erythropolis]